MPTLHIESTWRSYTTVEVSSEDYEAVMANPGNLSRFPESVLEAMDTLGAELIDWDIDG